MTPQSSIVIFQALETSAASLTSVSSASSLASTASTASTAFISQKTSWSWLFDHPCHQNNKHRSLVVDWILKNPIFHWYLVPFLTEIVEASHCHFFKNWLKKLKFPNLRTHWSLHYNLKVIFRWSPRPSKYIKWVERPCRLSHIDDLPINQSYYPKDQF